MALPDSQVQQEEQAKRNSLDQFRAGFVEGSRERSKPAFAGLRETLSHNSMFNERNVASALNTKTKRPLPERAGMLAGAGFKDIATDGSRVVYWAMNHPLAMAGAVGEKMSEMAGLSPDREAEAKMLKDAHVSVTPEVINEHFNRRMGFADNEKPLGIPPLAAKTLIPLLASAALIQTSGNHDMLDLLGGARPKGFEAVIPVEGDSTRSSNLAGELISRYLFGRTGRLLPWEQFTQERPDISPNDYGAYRAHQYDKGLFDIGLIKSTSRNLEGEPEFTMMGFRTPLSSIATAGGAMAGGVQGAILAAKDLQDHPGQRRWMGREEGPRRMAGAALGALLGGIGGNLGSRGLNAAVIQPLLNPQANAEQAAWLQQQRALGAL